MFGGAPPTSPLRATPGTGCHGQSSGSARARPLPSTAATGSPEGDAGDCRARYRHPLPAGGIRAAAVLGISPPWLSNHGSRRLVQRSARDDSSQVPLHRASTSASSASDQRPERGKTAPGTECSSRSRQPRGSAAAWSLRPRSRMGRGSVSHGRSRACSSNHCSKFWRTSTVLAALGPAKIVSLIPATFRAFGNPTKGGAPDRLLQFRPVLGQHTGSPPQPSFTAYLPVP